MSQTPDILTRILKRKVEEITERSTALSMRELSKRIDSAPPPRDFTGALRAKLAMPPPGNHSAVIAEITSTLPPTPEIATLPPRFSSETIRPFCEKKRSVICFS